MARHYGIRTDRYKLIHFYPHSRRPDMDEWELFDLEKDPSEMKSVYDDPAYSDVVTRLKQQLEQLRTRYKDDGNVVGQPPESDKKKAA